MQTLPLPAGAVLGVLQGQGGGMWSSSRFCALSPGTWRLGFFTTLGAHEPNLAYMSDVNGAPRFRFILFQKNQSNL